MADRTALMEDVLREFEHLNARMADFSGPTFLGLDITMAQAKVLFLIRATGSIQMSDLGARLGVTVPTVTGIVDRLVERELVVRRGTPDDRRRVVIEITPPGVELIDGMRDLSAEPAAGLLGVMDEAELAHVARLPAGAPGGARTLRGHGGGCRPRACGRGGRDRCRSGRDRCRGRCRDEPARRCRRGGDRRRAGGRRDRHRLRGDRPASTPATTFLTATATTMDVRDSVAVSGAIRPVDTYALAFGAEPARTPGTTTPAPGSSTAAAGVSGFRLLDGRDA